MAILIPSKNIYNKENKKIRSNQIKGVEITLNNATNDTQWNNYFMSGGIKALDVYYDGNGLSVNRTNTETQFLTTKQGVSQLVKFFWQIVEFNIEANKYFTNTRNFNLLENIIFNTTQNLHYVNSDYKAQEGTPTSVTWEYVLRTKGLPISNSVRIIDQKPTNSNISDIVKENTIGFQFAYVYFEEINQKNIKGTFLFSIGDETSIDGAFVNGRYSTTSSVDIKMRIGDLQENEEIYKGINQNFSIVGNELLQSYNKLNGKNYYLQLLEEISSSWGNGKETATILCSISDYYYYIEGTNENKGLKVISVDNSTGKMSFKMYDQVIPMVYGADGKDRPMSTYQDGSPKVFQVLGSKIYYDGAVWQELSLQEVDKNEIN